MSLTAMGRALAFVLLLAFAAITGRAYAPALAGYLAEARSSTRIDAQISDRALVYRLHEAGALSFAFSQPASEVKVLVQPAVSEADRARRGGFVYGLRLRLLDGEGGEIAEHEIHLQSDAPDAAFATGETWRFFRGRAELAGEQDQLLLDSPVPAARIEIEPLEPDRAIRGIDVRVYEKRPFLSAQPLATFRRMSERDRRELAAANAFPMDMLTRQEMEYIAINQWRPVGPQGIEGRDYQALVLYEASQAAIAEQQR